MNKTLKLIATSYTAIVFIVIALSGIMMYFKIMDSYVKTLHEDIGLFFVIAVLLHVAANWKTMKSYFNKRIFIIACILITCVSTLYIFQSNSKKGGHPGKAATNKLLNASLEISLPVFNIKYNNAVKILEQNGLKVENAKSLSEIAKTNDTHPFRILGILNNSNKEKSQ